MIWDEIVRLREKEIPEAQFNLEKEMANATRCTANLSGMPGGHQPGSVVEKSYAKIEQRKDELMRLIYRLDELKGIVTPLIATLEAEKEKRAMILRFLEGKSMVEIRYELDISTNYAYGLIRSARMRLDPMPEDAMENEVPTVS